MERVLVAMSGGVDSSVAAVLLQEAGYECVGVTMRLYENELVSHRGHTCCSLDDVEDARSVAYKLGMEYHVFDFSHAFDEKVIQKFVSYYEKGWTPNPCIDCNRYLKFDHLLQHADALDCAYIATGHYAQIREEDGRYLLTTGVDAGKDQTYALYSFGQEVLRRTLLPIGAHEKKEVRRIAEEHGLINAGKHDSQDICFVPDGDYVGFLERYTGKTATPGALINPDGQEVGTHRGAIGYTIGQRRGLGVAAPEPLYVYDKDMETNRVMIGTKEHLFATGLLTADWNWIMAPFSAPTEVMVKIRYNAKAMPALLRPTPDAEGLLRIDFEEPLPAVAPGQAVVCYIGDTVVGGGTIVKALKS